MGCSLSMYLCEKNSPVMLSIDSCSSLSQRGLNLIKLVNYLDRPTPLVNWSTRPAVLAGPTVTKNSLLFATRCYAKRGTSRRPV